MKCAHCNGEHPDGFKFCPVTGKEIVQSKKACTNPECIDFEKYILPIDALFCPRCGIRIDISKGSHYVIALEDDVDNVVILLDINTKTQSKYKKLKESKCASDYPNLFNVLLLHNIEEHSLYSFSYNTGLVRIGEYDEDNERQWFELLRDGYLWYVNDSHYSIYKYLKDELILIWEFQCEIKLWTYSNAMEYMLAINRYLVVDCDDLIGVVDLNGGKMLHCKTNHIPIAYDNGEFIYLHIIYEDDKAEIVTQAGRVLHFGEIDTTHGFKYFRFIDSRGKVGLLDSYGKVVLPCIYDGLKPCGEAFLLSKREYDKNEIYIPRKDKWVYELWNDKYLVINNDDSVSIFNDDDLCLGTYEMWGEFIPTGLPEDHCIYGTTLGGSELFSKREGKKLLEFGTMDAIMYSPDPDSAFPYSCDDIDRFIVKNEESQSCTVYDMNGKQLYKINQFGGETMMRFSKSGYIAYFNGTSNWGYWDKEGRHHPKRWSGYEDTLVEDAYVFSDNMILLFTDNNEGYEYHCNIINKEGKVLWRLYGRHSVVVYSEKIMAIYPDDGGTILLNHEGEELMRSENRISFVSK